MNTDKAERAEPFVFLRVHPWFFRFGFGRGLALGFLLTIGGAAAAAQTAEVVIDFESATIGKPVPT